MFFPGLKSKTHWVYDDPSGVPEGPLLVRLPEPLRVPVEAAAANAGVTNVSGSINLVHLE